MDPSSSSRNKKDKLSVRKQTLFKKPSTSLLMRQETLLRKACELSTLCDNKICVIHYDRDGNLVKTWPEDESQVQDIAVRFSQLTDEEKQKKTTNLSKFYNKKMHDEKKRSLSDKNVRIKFSKKVQDLEGSLVNKLQLLQDITNRLAVVPEHHQQQTESATRTEQDMSRSVYNSDAAATNALNHHQSKFSIFMFNHENATFTQLAPHSNLEQSCYNDLNDNRVLLGEQGFIDNNLTTTQGFNFGYDNNSVTSPLPGEQVNYGYYNSLLDTQGFGGYDNNLNNTQDFNFGYDFNNLCT